MRQTTCGAWGLVSFPSRWDGSRSETKPNGKTMAASVPPDGPPITKVRTSRLHVGCIFVETDNRVHRPAHISDGVCCAHDVPELC